MRIKTVAKTVATGTLLIAGAFAFDVGRAYKAYQRDQAGIDKTALTMQFPEIDFWEYFDDMWDTSPVWREVTEYEKSVHQLVERINAVPAGEADKLDEIENLLTRSHENNEYLIDSCINALGRIGNSEAMTFLYSLAVDADRMVQPIRSRPGKMQITSKEFAHKAGLKLYEIDKERGKIALARAGYDMIKLVRGTDTEEELRLLMDSDPYETAVFVNRNKDKPFVFNHRQRLRRMFYDTIEANALDYDLHCSSFNRKQMTLARAYRFIDPAEANAASYDFSNISCFSTFAKRIMRGEY